MAKRLEDLPVYQHALRFTDAVIAILDRPPLRRDRTLWRQISDANDSIVSNMQEGFEQPTDDGFARFLGHAKASCAEVVVRLAQAHRKRYLTDVEHAERSQAGEELQKMLGGFIRYLHQSGFRDRGSFSARRRDPDAGSPN